MDALNLSWRGQPHSGKRTALHASLRRLAQLRGVPFIIQTKQFFTGGVKADTTQISTTADDDGDDGGSDKDCFPYEFSYVHVGFDISRMSMQDKIYLKPILQRWSVGSQVLAGNQERASRILVFYHAHLFSTESYFLLHSLLENNFGDVSIWMTSELPVAERLADYFIEIPVAKTLVTSGPTWHQIFEKTLTSWSQKQHPKLSDTMVIRSFLYELLMRNLRWTDCVHYLLDVTMSIGLEPGKRKKVLEILAKQEATAAGQTIPSYRIPLLWEALFLELREALSQPNVDGGASSCIENPSQRCETVAKPQTSKVGARQSKSKGASHISNGSHA